MKSRAYSILYMFLLTLVFTALVGGVKLLSQERIARNQDLKLQRIVLQVLGLDLGTDLTDRDLAEKFRQRVRTVRVKDRTIYLALKKDQGAEKVAGIAFPFSGQGFWGPIQGIAAVDPKGKKLIGLAFYKHNETPGLGGRITEGWFQSQFKGLALRRMDGGGQSFRLVPAGTGRSEGDLDAITGASQTSQAVERFLNKELDYFLRELAPQVLKEKTD